MPGDASRENGKKGGRPKGALSQSTIKRNQLAEIMREEIAALVRPQIEELVQAQMAHAKGVSFMRLRYPDGRFANATDEKQIDAAIAAGAQWFEIFTQAPNPQAFVALMDRTIGKPSEHVELSGDAGGPIIVRWKE